MLINFKKQKLTLGQLKSRNIIQNISADEKKVIKVINDWFSDVQHFELTTSGSTGKPSTIQLNRTQLIYSAETSLNFLNSQKTFESALLCINPDFIGGKMVIIRSILARLDLTVIQPSSGLDELPVGEVYDLTSMVPMQLQYLLDHEPFKLKQLRTILIGGAPLAKRYQEKVLDHKHLKVYQTYGMTETASHVALKCLSEKQNYYQTLGDLQIDVDGRDCLRIKGTNSNNQWIQTNDVVEIISDHQFIWNGRADFIINSGGIKIHPEILEQQLSDRIKFPYFVAGIKDDQLGERAVLIIESDDSMDISFDDLDRYKRPKEVHFMEHFIYTENGKINRKKTLKLINL